MSSIEERYWLEQKKKQEAKLKIGEMRREELDEHTAFVWVRVKPMPSKVVRSKHRVKSLAREFERRGFRKGREICEHRVEELDEAIQSGFAAVPSVMVDDELGAYEVLMREMGMPQGYGLDDYPSAEARSDDDGAED